MVLIDAHTHLRTGKLSGTPTPPSAAVALQLLEEDMEQAEVGTSLVVTWPEDVPELATEAARAPGTLYSLLWFDSRWPERSLQELAALVEQFPAVLVGVKTIFPYLFGSDRLMREEKYFRRVQVARTVPPPYRDDLCSQTALRVYRLREDKTVKDV